MEQFNPIAQAVRDAGETNAWREWLPYGGPEYIAHRDNETAEDADAFLVSKLLAYPFADRAFIGITEREEPLLIADVRHRRITYKGERAYTCPVCRNANRLTLVEQQSGEQCQSCANADHAGH